MLHPFTTAVSERSTSASRLRIATLILSIAFIIGALYYYTEVRPPAVAWGHLADDLELAEITVPGGAIFSPKVTLLRSTLEKYQVVALPASRYGSGNGTVKDIADQSGAILGINANFFDEHGRPLGVVLSHGNLTHSIHRGGRTLTGILQATRENISIIGRDEFNPNGVLEAVQAGPRLIVAGEARENLRDLDSYERRAGVCVDKNKRLVFYISSGIMGISFRELIKILLHPDVGCIEALNLDGGGSAQLYVSADLPGATSHMREISLPGSDAVPVALGLAVR